jgi:hypothetical protein
MMKAVGDPVSTSHFDWGLLGRISLLRETPQYVVL